MSDATVKKKLKDAQFSVNPVTGLITASIGDAKVEVSADGKTVTTYSKDGVAQEIAIDAARAGEGTQISLSKDFSAAVLNGVTIKQAADGHLVIAAAAGTVVINKPAPANDTAVAAVKEALEPGQTMADGTVYAGLSADGKSRMFAMPEDLCMSETFNEAVKTVSIVNRQKEYGHDDWQIPSLENLRVLQKNQNEGVLKGSFKTAASSGSDCPDWYWSSTDGPHGADSARVVRFADGDENWYPKDFNRLSCRPVRLVPIL